MSSDERSSPNNTNHTSWIGKLSHILKGEPNDKEDLADIISDAGERDIIDEDTQEMLEGVFEISELRVRDIMIPRSQMVTIPAEVSIEEATASVVATGHSRFPVIHEDKDHVEGILLAKDLLKVVLDKDSSSKGLDSIIRPAVVVPESKRVDRLLKDFQTCRYHMAIVVDEYGGVSGLVTIEDILELIVGEIEDEYDNDDSTQENITEIGNKTFHIASLTPIEEFNEKFDVNFSDDEFDTIGGMVMHHIGHLPIKGDKVTIENFEFKILSADKRSLHILQLIVLPKAE